MIAMNERPGPAAQIGGMIFAVLLIDSDNRVAEANQAAETMLGQSVGRMVGKKIENVVKLQDERVIERLQASDSGLVARDVALRASRRDLQVNLTVSPLLSHPGWRVMTLSDGGHGDDRNEGDGRTATLSAPAILAHEIKNPLAAIRGAGQLVARKLNPEDKPLARMITDEVDRIARLIDRMQQLGSTVVEPAQACNPHEAIRSAIATVRAGDSEGIEILEEFDPSLPPVLGSRDALEQVLINLISNARDAARNSEKPRIVVRTRFISGLNFSSVREGRAVQLPIEISVSDNGPGIDEKLRESIFEPFVTSKKSGQGLGLALVRKLVRDMDGRISHQRENREGITVFRLHLPMAQEVATA